VTIKFIAPAIEETPAKCIEKIAASTEAPLCANTPLSGAYKVQPVPQPASIQLEINNKLKDIGNNQNEILFKRGNAISTQPNIIGTNQLPYPPIKIGITIKKIMISA